MNTWFKAWLEHLACAFLITQLLMRIKKYPTPAVQSPGINFISLICSYVAHRMQPVCQRLTRPKAVQQTGRSFKPVRKYDFLKSLILQKFPLPQFLLKNINCLTNNMSVLCLWNTYQSISFLREYCTMYYGCINTFFFRLSMKSCFLYTCR